MGQTNTRFTKQSAGGLLNATLGNAAELIIAFSALHAGLVGLVLASIQVMIAK